MQQPVMPEPLANASMQSEHDLATPLLRVFLCGLPTIEVMSQVQSVPSLQSVYQPLPPEKLRGRGAVPALMLLKLLTCQPHRYAPKDWLMEHLAGMDEEMVSEARLDDIASLLRGLLCPTNIEVLAPWLKQWGYASEKDKVRKQLVTYIHGGKASGPGYQLAPYPLLWMDVDALDEAVRQATRMERFGDDALPSWERAYALASHGVFLADERYSDWARERRDQVAGQYRQSVHALARLYRQQGHVHEAERILRDYIMIAPMDEDVLRPLMELLGDQERYQEAISYYTRTMEAFREEGRMPDERTNDVAEYVKTKELRRAPKVSHKMAVPIEGVTSLFAERAVPFSPSPVSPSDVIVPLPVVAPLLPTEGFGADCATWFSERLAQIIAFVLQRQRQLPVTDFGQVLDRELCVFDTVKAMFDADTYFLSRRSALLVIAALPHGLLHALKQSKAVFIEEEFLPTCAASLVACWYLLNGREFESVERTLSRYMPFLVAWSQQASSYQKTAAYLVSQAYLLLGLISLHRLQFQQRVAYCKEAARYGRVSGDSSLSVKCLTQLGNAYYDQHLYQNMLRMYQEAYQDMQYVPVSLQSKVLMGLAHAYAQFGNAQESLNAISEAHAIFPDEVKDLPAFLSADDGIYSLILFEGWVRLDLGKHYPDKAYYKQAADALAQVEQLPQTNLLPERYRTEILNRQAQVALALEDLDVFCSYTLQSAKSLKLIQSEKRRQELASNYRSARQKWPHERRVLELADIILETNNLYIE